MAARAIVTSQPDVACDMCGRRLLRGEHPEMFLAGGERRTVCELCAPRAAHEGWLRESDGHEPRVRPPRRRRGVSLLGRLRQLREPARIHAVRDGGSADQLEEWDELLHDLPASLHANGASGGDPGAARVLEVFNAGEQPRRVAGVARSLGAPSVTVRPLAGSRFAIVVAWELCWYRYEVDLDDELAGVLLVEKGLELAELPAEDRLTNAAADERGELTLLA